MVTLVSTIHDPHDRELAQAHRVLPVLHATYARIVLLASAATSVRSVQELRAAGVLVVERQEHEPGTLESLGSVRRAALAAGLRREATYIHLCDWDRALHWAESYPDELRDVVHAMQRHDCLILGRTARAFATHPRVQRDTESIINHCFGLVWGSPLDVTAASRGLSRRAAERLVAECDEPTIGNDCVWPLFLARRAKLAVGYMQVEGLEWETPDRFTHEIAAAGGFGSWLADHDADLARWANRPRLAEV